MPEESVEFTVDDIVLEGVLHHPHGGGPSPGVVMCHPHPQYGGNMFNCVVVEVCRALANESVAAFRFNFRGVGGSQGSYSDGIGEQGDVKGAITFLSSLDGVESSRIGLAGYSFGSMVAFPVSQRDERVKALFLISPIIDPSALEELQSYNKPMHLLFGEEDQFINPPSSQAEMEGIEIIPGADHFWWGFEEQIATKASAFFSKSLR
ncbi:MAG: dienelactone hydrolase family protein [Spirochaetota bacterium]|nr:dienelactone hydrolase family protein [Spirochaetota bacterium]